MNQLEAVQQELRDFKVSTAEYEAELESQLVELEETNGLLEQKLADALAQVERLRSELSKTETLNETLCEKVTRLEVRNDDLETKVRHFEFRVGDLEVALNEEFEKRVLAEHDLYTESHGLGIRRSLSTGSRRTKGATPKSERWATPSFVPLAFATPVQAACPLFGDVSRDVSRDVSQDVTHDMSQDVTIGGAMSKSEGHPLDTTPDVSLWDGRGTFGLGLQNELNDTNPLVQTPAAQNSGISIPLPVGIPQVPIQRHTPGSSRFLAPGTSPRMGSSFNPSPRLSCSHGLSLSPSFRPAPRAVAPTTHVTSTQIITATTKK